MMNFKIAIRLHRGPSNFTMELEDINFEGMNDFLKITLNETIIDYQIKQNRIKIGINYSGDLYDIMGNPVEVLRFKSNDERDLFERKLVDSIEEILGSLTGIDKEKIHQYRTHRIFKSNLYYKWKINN